MRFFTLVQIFLNKFRVYIKLYQFLLNFISCNFKEMVKLLSVIGFLYRIDECCDVLVEGESVKLNDSRETSLVNFIINNEINHVTIT